MGARDILLGAGAGNSLLAFTAAAQYSPMSAVGVNANNFLYAAGFHEVGGNGGALVTKFNRSLQVSWQKQFPMLPDVDRVIPYDLAVSPAGNLYLAGSIAVSSGYVGYLCKMDAGGNLIRQTKISYGTFDSMVVSVTLDASENIYVLLSYSGGTDPEYFIVKFNSSFDWQWTKKLSSTTYTTVGGNRYQADLSGLSVDVATGALYIYGTAHNLDGAGYLSFLMQLDSASTIQWQKYYKDSQAGHIAFSDGNLWLAPTSWNPSTGTFDRPGLLKLDLAGNVLWGKALTPAVPYGGAVGLTVNTVGMPILISAGGGVSSFSPAGDLVTQRKLTHNAGAVALGRPCRDSNNNVYAGGALTLAGGFAEGIVIIPPVTSAGAWTDSHFTYDMFHRPAVDYAPVTGAATFALETASVSFVTTSLAVSNISVPFGVEPII